MNELENLKKKILYRSNYRGTKEMDILLGSFVKYYIDKLSIEDLYELEKLLDFEDDEIYNFYQNNINTNEIKNNKISKLLKIYRL